MAYLLQAALLLIISNFAVANNSTNGCKLMVPQAAQEKLEPDQEPLYIIVKIQHLDISDVPSSGGSFGVDVGWVLYNYFEYKSYQIYYFAGSV